MFANSASSEMLAAIPRAIIAVIVPSMRRNDAFRIQPDVFGGGQVSCVSWNIVTPHGMPAPKRRRCCGKQKKARFRARLAR
jgi:hypothetical protein